VLTGEGLDFELVPVRYRTHYFAHIFAGGYSAGYYGYIWSEVLDADTVEWFKENGGLSRAAGEKFENWILSRGGSADPIELFKSFRGREASPEYLMRRRGLVAS
jgi:peptidyl-dipeptidase Dcp